VNTTYRAKYFAPIRDITHYTSDVMPKIELRESMAIRIKLLSTVKTVGTFFVGTFTEKRHTRQCV